MNSRAFFRNLDLLLARLEIFSHLTHRHPRSICNRGDARALGPLLNIEDGLVMQKQNLWASHTENVARPELAGS
jgi:hypothetical protein